MSNTLNLTKINKSVGQFLSFNWLQKVDKKQLRIFIGSVLVILAIIAGAAFNYSYRFQQTQKHLFTTNETFKDYNESVEDITNQSSNFNSIEDIDEYNYDFVIAGFKSDVKEYRKQMLMYKTRRDALLKQVEITPSSDTKAYYDLIKEYDSTVNKGVNELDLLTKESLLVLDLAENFIKTGEKFTEATSRIDDEEDVKRLTKNFIADLKVAQKSLKPLEKSVYYQEVYDYYAFVISESIVFSEEVIKAIDAKDLAKLESLSEEYGDTISDKEEPEMTAIEDLEDRFDTYEVKLDAIELKAQKEYDVLVKKYKLTSAQRLKLQKSLLPNFEKDTPSEEAVEAHEL
jgi:hypothetical protein